MPFVEKLRGLFAQKLGRLNFAARFAVIILACLVICGVVFWLCNELVYFYVARSYAEELADAYDLNRGLTRATLWASFAAIVVLAGYSFSFSKQKRRIGYTGLLALVMGHSLLLGRIDANFRKNGVAEQHQDVEPRRDRSRDRTQMSSPHTSDSREDRRIQKRSSAEADHFK